MTVVADIAINRLRIRAPKTDARTIASDLANGSWSVTGGDEWLFIRKVAVASNKQQLRQTASEAVKRAIAQAVDGRLAGAASANAVRFHSYAELLAYLLRDLADGSALQHWYWRRWSYLLNESKGNAVARVLFENAEHLAALIEQLGAIAQLENVWRLLTDQSARQILQRLQADVVAAAGTGNSSAPLPDPNTLSSALVEKLCSKPLLMRPWVAALSGLGPADNRLRLAALITGLRHYPLHVVHRAEQYFDAFASVLSLLHSEDLRSRSGVRSNLREAPVLPPRRRANLPAHTASERRAGDGPGETATAGRAAADTQPLPSKNSFGRVAAADAIDSRLAPNSKLTPPQPPSATGSDRAGSPRSHAFERDAVRSRRLRQEPLTQREHGQAGPLSAQAWETRCAGFFYLINALRGHTCQAILQADTGNLQNSGWIWLFDLCRRMDVELDYSLHQFIADECGFSTQEELLAQPEMPGVAQVETLLRARYAHQELWNRSLIRIPGWVEVSASHVDVFYALKSVRLQVRLAGLDVNPGWIPWLGRVVYLHYRDSDALPWTDDNEALL